MVYEQYKKTFLRIQTVVLGATLMIWAISHSRDLAGLFFVVMQASALVGASWGARLKHKVDRASGMERV